jgi:DNA phosphorothioation-dependent restriction protein DptG
VWIFSSWLRKKSLNEQDIKAFRALSFSREVGPSVSPRAKAWLEKFLDPELSTDLLFLSVNAVYAMLSFQFLYMLYVFLLHMSLKMATEVELIDV